MFHESLTYKAATTQNRYESLWEAEVEATRTEIKVPSKIEATAVRNPTKVVRAKSLATVMQNITKPVDESERRDPTRCARETVGDGNGGCNAI